MTKNLVIVESPAKAKTIEKFLGKDFTVRSSYGHIRDLDKGDSAIDVKNNFAPKYVVSPDKKNIVTELKKLAKESEMVWLASDEDREGEAISWHLFEVLDLKPANTKRIVFHEITKPAIENAIKNPRDIDKNLVDAQQARRVLDRLVGFELSPILWKKVKPSLSAGRVQSVAVRLIVEREREINNFNATSDYKITAQLSKEGDSKIIKAELPQRFKTKEQAEAFLQSCVSASYAVDHIEVKPTFRKPAAPFTTSTLQQEASRKLGYPVGKTMLLAQKLYEAGFITYMRTDSVNLSQTAIKGAEAEIKNAYGDKFSEPRNFTTKTAGAQEAHEAIRPTYFNEHTISGDAQEKRLYELIWKRAIASQMANAELEKTVVDIAVSGISQKLRAEGEVLKFEGFLKVYLEGNDDDEDEGEENAGMLPPLKVNEKLNLLQMVAEQKFSRASPRYTEASLVKKLEELGIGRPSTYAPTISTVQKRGYVVRENREGKVREYNIITLKNDAISARVASENTGAEKSKLFPTDIGSLVTDFLTEHFGSILDYGFTASVEKEFDDIASGLIGWEKMIDRFYGPFHATVNKTLDTAERVSGERELGKDPVSGLKIIGRIGRFGPLVQIGETTETEKAKFASLRPGQSLDTITLEQALDLFKMPREVGTFEGNTISAAIGRFGPYLKFDKLFISIPKDKDPFTINEEESVELIKAKRIVEAERLIKTFTEDADLELLNGRWGPYIAYKKSNYKIPKTVADPKTLSFLEIMEIIRKGDETDPKKKAAAAKKAAAPAKKAPAKKTAAKKTAAKKTVTKK
ncbi:MAG: type I DNA topoisomerase [Bacteroidia bacterium]|nr:type I DNA topoisomerase [Bacteroidia bacterium]